MTSERQVGQRGVTLIELMVSLVITSIAIAAAFGIAYSMVDSHREHQRAMAVEQAARGSLDILSEALRSASPGVLSGKVEDLAGCSGDDGAIAVVNNLSGLGPDALGVIHASGGVLTWMTATFDCSGGSCPGTMTVADASELSAGDFLIVTTFDQGYLLGVTDVSGNTLTLAGACTPTTPVSFPPGSLVIRARISVFTVDTTSYGVPMLMVDPDSGSGPAPPEPVAEGIEDLQIAVAYDTDGDGEISELGAAPGDDEWYYNVPGESAPMPMVAAPRPWRAVRVTVIARSTRESGGVAESFRPGAEDREAATTADVFKRRMLSTTVELRNLQGSP